MAVTTVIFDIGKVLNGYGWEALLKDALGQDEQAFRRLEQAIFLNPAWVEHDKGLLTEEEEIRDFAAAAPEHEDEIRRVYARLGECAWIEDYAMDWVRSLKEAGYRVYALSNWPEKIYSQRGHNLDFLELMDGYCLSWQTHLNKPDPEAFQNLFRRYGIQPEEAVFIDDNEENVQAAQKLGLQTIRFFAYEAAVEELEKLGVCTEKKKEKPSGRTPLFRRILALIGAVLLVCMYLLTLVFSLLGSPQAAGWLRASIAMTVFVPVLLYAFSLVRRLLTHNKAE